MQLNFGVGTIIGKRTDIANAKPSFLGVVQDLEIDIAVTLKELTGAYKMPIDIAPAAMKVTGKAKFARIQGATVNNLLLGQTETDAAGIDMAVAEQHTVAAAVVLAASATTAAGNSTLHIASVPATVVVGMLVTDTTTSGIIPAGTYVTATGASTVTMSAAATGAGVAIADSLSFAAGFQVNTTSPSVTAAEYNEDLGVFYASNSVQLQPVLMPAALGTGQYAVQNGFYNFSAGDVGAAINTYYGYTVTSLVQLSLANQLMGTGPVFELQAKQDYFVQGVEKKLIVKLNACRGSKWSFPFKNTDFTIQDFEFTAFCDASNNWGTFAFSE